MPGLMFGSMFSSAHIAPSELMTSIDQQGLSLESSRTFSSPNPHNNLTFECASAWFFLILWTQEKGHPRIKEQKVQRVRSKMNKISSRHADSTDSFDSLTICSCGPLQLVSPPDGTQCQHSTDEYVFAGQPKLVWPCVGVHRRMLHRSLSLLYQQCQVCFAGLLWMVCEMGGKWLYSCFVGCCFQDLFKTARSILI